MTTKNDTTGDRIQSKTNSQSYRDNFDQIFNSKGNKMSKLPTTVDDEMIDNLIDGYRFDVLSDGRTTICTMSILNDNFTVIGKSACLDSSNFDADIGQRIAYNDAYEQMWEHAGLILAYQRSEKGIV